jgi:hypothetical protein
MTKPLPPELKNKPSCPHDHKLQGSGAIFLQGSGWLMCNICGGVQPIRKPIEGEVRWIFEAQEKH